MGTRRTYVTPDQLAVHAKREGFLSRDDYPAEVNELGRIAVRTKTGWAITERFYVDKREPIVIKKEHDLLMILVFLSIALLVIGYWASKNV